MVLELAFVLQSQSVTLDILGERLETAAPKIANAIGIESVVISPKFENQVVMISVKNVPREEFIKQFEKTVNLSFVKRSEGWWLQQTPEQQISEEKAEREALDRKLNDALQQAKDSVAKQVSFSDTEAAKLLKDIDASSPRMTQSGDGFSFNMPPDYAKNQARTPASRFMSRVLARLKNFHLNGLTDANPRIVFSTQPTAMQRAFPFDVSDLVQQLASETDVWNAAIEDRKARQPKKESSSATERLAVVAIAGSSGSTFEIGADGGMSQTSISTRPIRGRDLQCMTLAVNIRNEPSFTLTVYDKSDSVILSNTYPDLGFMKLSQDRSEFGLSSDLKGKPKAKWMEFAEIFLKGQRYEVGSKPSGSLYQQLLNPESVEVTAHSLAPLLKQELGDRNIISVLDDSMLTALSVDLKAKHPLSANYFFDVANSAEINDRWALRGLLNPRPLRNQQVDRKKLGNYLRFFDKNKRDLTIEEEAGFVVNLPWIPNAMGTYSVYQRMMDFNIPGMNSNGVEETALRIYGSLSSTERELAKKSGIPLSQLNSTAQRELYRAIFSPDYANFYLEPALTPGGPITNQRMFFGGGTFAAPAAVATAISGSMSEQKRPAPSKYSKGKMQEPTFALPNGLQPGMRFVMSESSTPVLINGSEKKGRFSKFVGGIDPTSFGMMLQEQKNPQPTGSNGGLFFGGGSGFDLDENRIIVGRARAIKFGVVMPDEPMMKAWNLNKDVVEDAKLYSTSTLPDGIKKQLQDGMKMASDSKRSVIFRSGSISKTIPPQP
jgi:hypothetical protein